MNGGPSNLPPFLFTALFVVLVALVSFVLWEWTFTIDITTKALDEAFNDTQTMVADTIQDRAHILNTVNMSTFNLAKVVGSFLEGSSSSFSTVEKKVTPFLFLAYSTIACLSQISYIGGDGFFFSYHGEGNQTFSVVSNTSTSFSDHSDRIWYEQAVHRDTGITFGDVVDSTHTYESSSDWIKNALQHETGHVSLAKGLGTDQNLSFLFTAPCHYGISSGQVQEGVVSMGISLESFVDHLIEFFPDDGALYLMTKSGEVLAERGLPYTVLVPNNSNSNSSVTMKPETTSDASCRLKGASTSVTVQNKTYHLRCALINIVGIQMVSIIALPSNRNSVPHQIHKVAIAALSLLLAMLIVVAFASSIMFQFVKMFHKKEMLLHASLIRQKEATQQAERKSMNKSLAFASASHDVRNALAGIAGLIEVSRGEVSENSEMNKNLDQMSVCASKLLDILNTVLDTSKVEAGKMQLEENEFDMAQVIEESVDIYHIIALKKGLEVIWDPCDCSIVGSLKVKGDCRRFKQILDNLLCNAVKFTSNGHVVVRAWAKKASPSGSTLPSDDPCQLQNLLCSLSRLLCKKRSSRRELDPIDVVHPQPDCIEFVFEVDDTGRGIPKENRDSVFENYVQVKESTYEGHYGTGLGLGIVQSYVRLMGGEIGIIDKNINEKGTCFRFNIFLKALDESERESIMFKSPMPRESQKHVFSVTADVQQSELDTMAMSNNKFQTFVKGLKKDGIHLHAVLFIQGEATRRIAESWIEKLGVKVSNVNSPEQFGPTLESLKNGLILGCFSASGTSKVYSNCSPSYSLNREEVQITSQCMMEEGFDHNLFLRRTSPKRRMTHVLIVVDMSHGPLSEIFLSLKSFVKDLYRHQYKIIWLVDSNIPSSELRRLADEETPIDLILRKPFHGSRLCEVMKLLHEFEGSLGDCQSESRIQITSETINESPRAVLIAGSKQVPFTANTLISATKTNERFESRPKLIDSKPLSGMTVLVVEDILALRLVASAIVSSLGGNVALADNGEIALSKIQEALAELSDQTPKCFPYDLILMDCEMPIMNGYEATRQIRLAEKRCGLHIPIIATSAHESDDQVMKSIEVGIDFHLTKPLQKKKLLDAIHGLRKASST